MRSRRNNKVSFWLIPFYAVFIVAAAAALIVYVVGMVIVTVIKAVRQTRKASKADKPAPAKTKRDRDFEDIEDRWEATKPRGKTEARWRGPTKTADGTRVVHKVGGKRVLGKIVDIDDLAEPELPPPPARKLVLPDGSTF